MKQISSQTKKITLTVLSVVVLVLSVIGLTYAAFNYSKAGEKVNTISTGSIIMSYNEETNGINIAEAEPMDDNDGKLLNGENTTFDFTVSASIGPDTIINYAITAIKEEGTNIGDEHVKVYLTSVNDEIEELVPTKISDLPLSDTVMKTGAPKGQRVLKQGTITKSEITHYRLRMWISSEDEIVRENIDQTYKLRVNVYGREEGVEDFDIENPNITLDLNGEKETKINLTGENADSVTYQSNNDNVEVSKDGTVTAKKLGTSEITIRNGSVEKQVTVTVQKTVTATYETGTGVSSADKDSDSCVLKSEEDTCEKELPNFEVENGYTALGWSKNADDTEGITGTITFKDNVTYYTVTKKEGVDITIVFHLNGAKSLDEKAEDIVKTCTADGEGKCTIKAPTIEGSDETPNVIGFSTTATSHTSTWGSGAEQEVSESTDYYAQTKSASSSKQVTVTINALDGVSSLSAETKKCSSYVPTYNGEAQTCLIILPTATVGDGYIVGYGFEEDNIVFRASEQIRVNTMTTEYTMYAKAVKQFYRVTYQKTDGIESMEKEYDSCALDGDSCTIQLPSFVAKDDYWGAWSTSSSSLQNKADIGSSITLTKDTTYYVYSTKKKFTITYRLSPKIKSVDMLSDTCSTSSIEEKSCTVNLPNVVPEEGYQYAFSTSSSEFVDTRMSGEYTLTKDTILYVTAVKKVVEITYQKGEGVTAIGKDSDSCLVRYDKDNCIVTFPSITSALDIIGWSSASTAETSKSSIYPNTRVIVSYSRTFYALVVPPIETIPENTPLKEYINDPSIIDYDTSTEDQKKKMFVFSHSQGAQQDNYTKEELTDYRYIGTNPDNYVTFNDETAGWRVIGVFTVENEKGEKEQRIKLMRNKPLEVGSDNRMSWDNKSSGTGSSPDYRGSNYWGDARLMMLMNPNYEEEKTGVSGSIYWNRQSGNCPTDYQDGTTPCDFTQTGLTQTSQKMIGATKWYLGGMNPSSIANDPDTPAQLYKRERGNEAYGVSTTSITADTDTEIKSQSILESISQPMMNAIANIIREISWIGHVGLIYPSDYGYTTSGGSDISRSVCLTLNMNSAATTDKNNCGKYSWFYDLSYNDGMWGISSNKSNPNYVIKIYNQSFTAVTYGFFPYDKQQVYPTVYLSSDVTLKQGTGKKDDPFEFELKS